MDYRQAEQYILAFTNYEKTPGVPYTLASYDLRRMDELLVPLDNPHLGPRTVHVTGTKGKGSTSAMVASVLRAAGYRTGLYTSPHLVTLQERIRVNGAMIPRSGLARLTTEIEPVVEEVNRRAAYGLLTTFEVLTALAFLHFQRRQVDFQVLEVGLGGRLDATNVCRPDVCVITSISLDHTEALGDTVAKIAAEKAGIVKPGCIAVTAPQEPEAMAVIEDTCRRHAVPLVKAGSDITWAKTGGDLRGQSFSVRGAGGDYDLRVPLLGGHQLENAAVAVAALEALATRGVKLSSADIKRGLAGVRWPGRLQVLRSAPFLVVDGAHNAYSAARLVQALTEAFPFERAFVVCGISVDKDIGGIVEQLARLGDKFIVTRANHPRAAAPAAVAAEFAARGVEVSVADSVPAALSSALAEAGKKDLVCVTGSLFVVGEALEFVRRHAGRL